MRFGISLLALAVTVGTVVGGAAYAAVQARGYRVRRRLRASSRHRAPTRALSRCAGPPRSCGGASAFRPPAS